MIASDIRVGFAAIARQIFDLGLAREMTARVYDGITQA